MKKIAMMSALLLVSALTNAEDYVLRVANKTTADLHQIYISHEKSDDWEDDILGEDEILKVGDSFKINLTEYNTPWFDIRGVDENGNEYIRYEVDVTENDVVLQNSDLEK